MVAVELTLPGIRRFALPNAIGCVEDFYQRFANQITGRLRLATPLTDHRGNRIVTAQPIKNVGGTTEIGSRNREGARLE
jgi:hypothetical protein